MSYRPTAIDSEGSEDEEKKKNRSKRKRNSIFLEQKTTTSKTHGKETERYSSSVKTQARKGRIVRVSRTHLPSVVLTGLRGRKTKRSKHVPGKGHGPSSHPRKEQRGKNRKVHRWVIENIKERISGGDKTENAANLQRKIHLATAGGIEENTNRTGGGTGVGSSLSGDRTGNEKNENGHVGRDWPQHRDSKIVVQKLGGGP